MLSGSVLRALVRSWGSNGSSTRLLASVVFPRSLTPTGLVIRLPQCVVLTSHQAHEGIQACRVTLQVANRIKIWQHPKYRRGRRPAPPKPGLTVAQLPAECKVVRSASPHRSDPCFQPPSPVYQSIPRTLSPPGANTDDLHFLIGWDYCRAGQSVRGQPREMPPGARPFPVASVW